MFLVPTMRVLSSPVVTSHCPGVNGQLCPLEMPEPAQEQGPVAEWDERGQGQTRVKDYRFFSNHSTQPSAYRYFPVSPALLSMSMSIDHLPVGLMIDNQSSGSMADVRCSISDATLEKVVRLSAHPLPIQQHNNAAALLDSCHARAPRNDDDSHGDKDGLTRFDQHE
jgi:hypothetical protein